MKKIRSYALGVILIFVVFLTPKLVNAQSITPSSFLIKNSDNTAILYQSSSRDYFSSTPYYSSKFEINLAGTSVDYNASYGIDMYLTLYVGAFSDYGNFGYANPELYINYNGLHQTGYTISSFTNTKGSCSNVVCPYQLHLAFTFATQYQGTLYLALPYDIPFDTYGWTLNSMELTNYGSNTSNSDIIANNNQNTQNIIANNNSNFGNLINNQNSNTQSIINNQNSNTDKEIESQKVCTNINVKIDNSNYTNYTSGYLRTNGDIIDNSGEFYRVSDYIKVLKDNNYVLSIPFSNQYLNYCLYNDNKEVLSCSNYVARSIDYNIIPNSNGYIRFSAYASGSNITTFTGKNCFNGNQVLSDNITDMNNTINDSDTSGAESELNSFFNNFQVNNHGLASLISSPVRLLQSLNNSSCTPLSFPLPFVNNNATLPCFKSIVSTHFSSFLTLYQLITNGLVAYWVCINLFAKVKGFQDPQSDKIEVLEL